MMNPFPVNLLTSAEVRGRGWQAESRDADGHLISCHAPIDADDSSIAEWIVECTSRGETVTFWPVNSGVLQQFAEPVETPPPSSHVALPEASQLPAEIHSEGHAADEGDPVVDCHRDASQKVSSEGTISGEQLLSKMSHGHVEGWNAHEEFKRSALAARQAFDHVVGKPTRLATVSKHEARNLQHLKGVYEAALEQSPEFADTLAWLLWWDIAKFDRLAELAQSSPAPEKHTRPYPDLLSEAERKDILSDAEGLWRALEANNLGGFSGHNRPFYILHAFKQVIEKYGKRDVGLTWSKNALDAAAPSPEPREVGE